MEYTELRKIRKRMSEGSVSNRATEALLEMYWREGLSLDEALRQYTHTKFGSDIETAEQICNELVTEVREDPYCEECKSREICTIHAELGYPIDYQGEIKRKEDIETGKPRRVRRGIFLFWEKAKSAFLKFDASG